MTQKYPDPTDGPLLRVRVHHRGADLVEFEWPAGEDLDLDLDGLLDDAAARGWHAALAHAQRQADRDAHVADRAANAAAQAIATALAAKPTRVELTRGDGGKTTARVVKAKP